MKISIFNKSKAKNIEDNRKKNLEKEIEEEIDKKRKKEDEMATADTEITVKLTLSDCAHLTSVLEATTDRLKEAASTKRNPKIKSEILTIIGNIEVIEAKVMMAAIGASLGKGAKKHGKK